MIEREGPLSLSRQCGLLGVTRSSQYYRPKGEGAENLALMRRMDELHMAYPFYGSRQMMRHLRREGVRAGRHRIRRLMRLMGMEATYRRPKTSAANPEHRVFPYLLRDLAISRADHVWCADITYVPVTQGFFYLVAVMDWATRHVLAWRLSNTMDASFCVEALDDALGWRAPEILNTDSECLGAGFPSGGLTQTLYRRFWRSTQGRPQPPLGGLTRILTDRAVTNSATGRTPNGSSAHGSISTTRCARTRPSAGELRATPIAGAWRCRNHDPARRHAWSRTGAKTPAPAAASADAGSLRLPIGSESRREDGGCTQTVAGGRRSHGLARDPGGSRATELAPASNRITEGLGDHRNPP